jgi:hypothetical protein
MPAQDLPGKKIEEEPMDKPVTRLVEAVEEENTVSVTPETKIIPDPVSSTVENLAKVQQVSEKSEIPQLPINVERTEKSGGSWVVWVVAALILGIAGGLGGGYYLWGSQSPVGEDVTGAMVQELEASPSGIQGEVKETTPTPGEQSVDRATIKIKVLNGSGVSGAASKAKALLEGLGYAGVLTGNADRDDYEKTQISVKTGGTAQGETVKSDLSKNYSVVEDLGQVGESESFDVLVILGVE